MAAELLCVCGCATCVDVERRLQTSDIGRQCVDVWLFICVDVLVAAPHV